MIDMNKKDDRTYVHYEAAHCESGAVCNMLKNSGLEISEPLIFGIASALIFFFTFPLSRCGVTR